MKLLRFAPVLLAIAPMWAASISVNTYCNPLTTQTDTGVSSTCSGTAPDGSLHGTNYVSVSQAQASASFTLLSDGFTFSGSAHGESFSQNPFLQPLNVDAHATATITDTIDIAGPVRPGFVELTCGGFCFSSFDGGAGDGSASITLGSLGTCRGFEEELYCAVGLERPIELGKPFQFSTTIEANGPGCALCDTGDGFAALNGMTVTFYEADRVTPVNIFEANPPVATPEPAAPLLMALGLLMVFGLTRRR
jgi:hypothetical protein